MAVKFLNHIDTKHELQFQNSSGTDAGKIAMDGDDLVLSNAVGDILFGDADSDIYIGDGVNSVDILFEQNGEIRGETGSSVTLTLGSSDTTLNLYDPQIANGMTLTSTMTIGTGGSIDFTPDTGVLLKFDGQTILERTTANGGLTLGHDDSIIIAGGDTSNTLNSNINNGNEAVYVGAEGGLVVYGFPNNDTSWSNRQQFSLSGDGKLYFGTASDTNLYRSAANTLKTDDDLIVGGGQIYITNTDTKLEEGNGNALRVTTPSGYLEIGSMNTSHAHIQTDRSNFYFNKEIRVDSGVIGSYNEDLYLRRATDSTNQIQITTDGAVFSKALYVPQYIYHNGDTNTYLTFDADRIRLVAGGTTKFDSNNTYLTSINNGNWSGTDLSIANGGTGASSASAARTNLGLGSMATANTGDYDKYEDWNLVADDDSSSAIRSDNYVKFTGASVSGSGTSGDPYTVSLPSSSNYYLNGISKSGNTLTFSVSGAANQTYTFGSNAFNSTTIPTNNNQLTNGAGYLTSINNSNWSGTDLSVANGGTGASTASGARTNLGLGTAATSASTDFVAVTGDSMTGKLTVEGNGVDWSETTQGTTTGSIHLDPVGTGNDNTGSAITFGASDTGGGATAHAGIYTRTDGNYGTKMYFSTTNDYSAGSKTRMMINSNGRVGIGTTDPNELFDVAGTARMATGISEGWFYAGSGFAHWGDGDTNITFDTNRVRINAGGTTKFDSNNTYLTAHPSISAASSVNNSGRTYIQDITLDSNGHVTAITSATETVTNTNTQLSNEQVQDIVGAMFNGNTETGLSASYQDSDGTIDLAISNESIQDIVGAMFSGNTETNITATYQDADGTIDLVATNTTYSTATSSTLGLVKIGYTENGKNYPVELSSGKMFVNVPWTDTNTNTVTSVGVAGSEATGTVTIAASGAASVSQSGNTITINATDTNTTYSEYSGTTAGLVPSGNGNQGYFLMEDGTWAVPTDTNTTYSAGAGLDLSGTTFSVEGNLSGDVYAIGRDGNDKYVVNTTNHAWYLDGVLDMRLNNNGNLDVDGDVIAYSTVTSSDRRLKTDIETLESASDKVKALRGVSFTWNHGKKTGKKDIGLIAQEVEEVVPEIVGEAELLDGTMAKHVDYPKLVALLIESNKELMARVETLEAKLDGITK